MSTAKLNAVGHRWVGELADFIGCDSAKRQDVAYVAALDLASCSELPVNVSPLTIDHSELVKAQREDHAIDGAPTAIVGYARSCCRANDGTKRLAVPTKIVLKIVTERSVQGETLI
ncbi:hypothetical protein NQZ68_007103 [Dissostichus eleginoides]|nr:hypothetical protein NQZ68_007103 [Dissostichus eleginoides]